VPRLNKNITVSWCEVTAANLRKEGKMKKEILTLISSFIITIILALSLCTIALHFKTTNSSINLLLDKIDGLENDYRASECKYEKELIDKVDELTRYKLMSEQENRDLKEQIKVFGGFWKGAEK
jgi:hypothetical protein